MRENFNSIEIQTTFQSRFGPQEWLTPYTDKTLEKFNFGEIDKILEGKFRPGHFNGVATIVKK